MSAPCADCPSLTECREVRECRATWDSKTRDAQFQIQRDHAETFPCPACPAIAGEACRNLITGEPLAKQPAHVARLNVRPEATP